MPSLAAREYSPPAAMKVSVAGGDEDMKWVTGNGRV
jgi:hypothetical protein